MSSAKDKMDDAIAQRLENEEAERRLNEAFMITFNCDAGRKVLDYLVASTLHTVNGPSFESNALIHLEGQRFKVSEIRQRIKNGEDKV